MLCTHALHSQAFDLLAVHMHVMISSSTVKIHFFFHATVQHFRVQQDLRLNALTHAFHWLLYIAHLDTGSGAPAAIAANGVDELAAVRVRDRLRGTSNHVHQRVAVHVGRRRDGGWGVCGSRVSNGFVTRCAPPLVQQLLACCAKSLFESSPMLSSERQTSHANSLPVGATAKQAGNASLVDAVHT
jgi:hypothetical protein